MASSILTVSRIVLIAAASAVVAGNVAAATMSLRFGQPSQPDPSRGPYADAPHQFTLALEKLLPGQFKIKVYPNRQLGDEKEMLEQVRFGTLDMDITTNAVVANVESSLLANDLPFLYPDAPTAHRVLDGPIGQGMLAKLEPKNLIGLAFFEGGFRHMMNNARPVMTPADVKGVKYRVMQNPVFIGMFNSLGGNAIPMAFGDLFTALRQGTVDGMELPITAGFAVKANEVTKYLSLTSHTYSALVMTLSKRTFKKLGKDQQQAFRKAALMANKTQRANNAKRESAALDGLKKRGMTINPVKDLGEFRAMVTPVYDQFRDRIGSALLDSLLAAVKK
jgi:tripartite ATP-independent transporter DctP family solute receptor